MHKLLHFILATTLVFSINQLHASGVKNSRYVLSDKAISSSITARFAGKQDFTHSKIDISTQRGVVTLTGTVRDKQAFAEAYWLARTARGVKAVDIDDLEIKRTNSTLSDAYITAKVETAVLKAKVLDDESIPLVGINATTVNGIVTLTGEVKQSKSIGAILKRANEVKGVKKIISTLHVKGESDKDKS